MKLSSLIHVLILGAAALGSASPLSAQHEERREYVQFPFGKDAETLVKERLRAEQQLGPYKRLIQQILADPDHFGIDPKMFKDVKMDEPTLKKAVRDWAASDPELQKAVRAWVKRLPNDSPPDTQEVQRELTRLQRELGPDGDFIQQILADPAKFGLEPKFFKDVNMYEPARKKTEHDRAANDPKMQQFVRERFKRMTNQPSTEAQKIRQELKQTFNQALTPPSKVKPPVGPRAIETKVDPLARAAETAMIQAENTRLGDWLKDSAAWNRAFRDLRGSFDHPDAGRLSNGEWASKVGLSQDRALQLTEGALRRLGDLPKPNAELWNWARSLPTFNQVPAPRIAAPELPTFDSLAPSSFGAAATWITLIAILLFAAWRMRYSARRAPTRSDHRATLGPWPVRPDAVSTRTELVQAFDYLALWSLGLDVKSWNHQAVACRWCERSPGCVNSAQALAALYEQARYTDGVDELPSPQRKKARQSLVHLAEAL